MQIFSCPDCGAPAFFHNLTCPNGHVLEYDPDAAAMRAQTVACANRETIGCNWPAEGGALCRACAMTETIPDPNASDNAVWWADAESAKRWVLANLARWGWFLPSDPGPRPIFRMLSEQTATGEANVTMGHASGVVTINVTEADLAQRVQRQEDLGESFRSMIGHFRHEIAHFLFERLAADPQFPDAFRALFGDERQDYGAALKRHYEEGPPPGSEQTHVTPYATAHPHEDWAESVAHVLHLTDIADSFRASNLASPEVPQGFEPYEETDSDRLVTVGAALAISLNHVSRSVGLSDVYPFVLTPPMREKLHFAHARLREGPRDVPQAADPSTPGTP